VPHTHQSLHHFWTTHVDDFGGGNHHSAPSFDSSRHPLPSWMAHVLIMIGLTPISFSFFFSFSFFLILRAGQILFSFDSVIPILIAIVLFTLIVYNSILFFLFYPWWYDFVNFFFIIKFDLHSYN